jgi:hypothetical protein
MNRLLKSAATVAFLMVCAAVGTAHAQTPGRFYVGGSIGGFSVDADNVDGRSPAMGAMAGFRVKPWLDIEGEVVVPSRHFTRTYGGDTLSLSFAPPGSSLEELQRLGVFTRFHHERDVSASISGVAIFHGPVHPRVHIGFLAGVTNHRVTDRTDYTPVIIGEGVDPNHPEVRAHSEVQSRNLGGPTIGANVSFALTPHLRIVPDIRYDYGSIGDEINNALRSSVRVHWVF